MHSRITWDSGHLPLADESVDTVVTDPPWDFHFRASANSKSVKATNYPLIDDRSLKDHFEELLRVLKKGGHLFVFVPDQKLELAFESLLAFDRFASMVWVKTTNDQERVRIGLGHTFRMCHEYVLAYSKGHRRPFVENGLASVQGYRREKGSVKPWEMYSRLVHASTPRGGIVLDPWAGSDPLGRARLTDWTTISGDIDWRRDWGAVSEATLSP